MVLCMLQAVLDMITDKRNRLAFDTIGFCAFGYRFNEFYTEKPHDFAQHMTDALIEGGKRGMRTRIETALHVQDTKKYWADIAAQHKLCDEIIQERIKNPDPNIHDMLNAMLNTADPETGEKLSLENVRYQMATFLVSFNSPVQVGD